MAHILAENVEVYVKRLIFEELVQAPNGDDHRQYREHTKGKTEVELHRDTSDARPIPTPNK